MPFIRSSTAIFLVLVAHAVGIAGVYWIFRWYDAPVHFLGGFAAGVLALDIWHFSLKNVELRQRWLRTWMLQFAFVVGIVSFIGIIWELHEYILDVWRDVGVLRQPSLRDTMSDSVMDLLGGCVAYGIFANTYKKD